MFKQTWCDNIISCTYHDNLFVYVCTISFRFLFRFYSASLYFCVVSVQVNGNIIAWLISHKICRHSEKCNNDTGINIHKRYACCQLLHGRTRNHHEFHQKMEEHPTLFHLLVQHPDVPVADTAANVPLCQKQHTGG